MSKEKDLHYFTHLVLFWLKNTGNEDHKELLLNGLKNLVAQSKYTQFSHIGCPAGTDRPVVDNSYDYSLFVTFESEEAQDQYQKEAAHVEFLDSCKHLWERIQVYDTVRENSHS